LSHNPFRADPAIRARFDSLDTSIGPAVRQAVTAGLARTRADVAANTGGILLRADVDVIRAAHGLAVEGLMLLARPVAGDFAHPPISDFHVGAVVSKPRPAI